MKQFKITALLLALACLSCQKEASLCDPDAAGQEGKASVFMAESESYETRTSLQEGYVLWNAGDRVSVFEGSGANGAYQVTDASAGSTSAELVPVSGGGFVAGTELDTNVAFYPYSSSASVVKNGEDYEVSVTLPQTQHYAEGSFGNGNFPMIAVTAGTEDKNLKFKNVLGCLKIQLKGDAVIKSITVTNRSSYPLWGTVKVIASNTNLPTVKMSQSGAKTVILDCGDGVQLNNETATAFLIALPPTRLTSGFTIDIMDTSGNHMIKSTTKLQTINRSMVLAMPELEVMKPTREYVDLGLPSGTLWATRNMGAMRPEDRGNYYAWGETKTMGEVDMTNQRNYEYNMNNAAYSATPYVKQVFQGLTYKFLKEGATNATTNLVKYTWEDGSINSSWYRASTFAGDNKTVLDPEDDAAVANWGDGWRTPTRAEVQELLDNCDITTTPGGDVLICEFKSRINGNSIIIPAGGYMSNTAVAGSYSSGYGVWTSSLYIKNGESFGVYSYQAAFLQLTTSSTNRKVHLYQRFIGLPIRPVRNK